MVCSFVNKLHVEADHSAEATVTEVVSNIFKAIVISGRIAERLLLTIHIGMHRLLQFFCIINISYHFHSRTNPFHLDLHLMLEANHHSIFLISVLFNICNF
jgi:hypothetical protein